MAMMNLKDYFRRPSLPFDHRYLYLLQELQGLNYVWRQLWKIEDFIGINPGFGSWLPSSPINVRKQFDVTIMRDRRRSKDTDGKIG